VAAAKRSRLTDAGIARLRPGAREYTVWDSRLPGLGVRVRPSGGCSWIFLRKTNGVTRRVSLGPAALKTVEEARRECHTLSAVPPAAAESEPIARAVPMFEDFVAGRWKEVHFDSYKPSTQSGVRYVLDRQLLPAFGSKPLDRITPARIDRWFHAYSRAAPGGANHALEILGQIMNFAVASGHVDTNPARGVKRNRRPALTRFLSREEVSRLHGVLDRRTGRSAEQQADIIRLLLLTGCRRSEIVRLRWAEVRDDCLVLADGKTGPRKVPLNSQSRRVLNRQPRVGSPFVFPSPRDLSRPRGVNLPLWYSVRREAGIEDARLHDLRHTHASHAVMNGVPVPVVSRLLGHSNVRMTLRYAHLGDRDIKAAAERVGQAVADIMDGGGAGTGG